MREDFLAFGEEHELKGLVLIATEGVNGTIAGTAEAIDAWKEMLVARFGPITFKDSHAGKTVFRRWSIKIKPEIVGLKNPQIKPAGKHKHLTPEQWQEMLGRDDVVLVDARNSFEYDVGRFRGAIDCGTVSFSEFPTFVEKADLPKDKKVLMYCTGGIRCEKALLAMEEKGYDDVYQLDGGILAYLQRFPNKDFEGECFVFDHRVAVDQQLNPSEIFGRCPHCGQPGKIMINCECGKSQHICDACSKDETQKTCSKRCRNELRKRMTTTA